jgi:hypothetical protein
MSAADTDPERPSEPPLWSIGLAVLLILGAPIILYSLAPTGPLRTGDTIFADGPQRASVSMKTAGRTQLDTCLLDQGNPLIIIEPPAERPDGMLLGRVQGNQAAEWPFCPPQAEVLLHVRQAYQKPDFIRVIQDKLTQLLRP